MKDIFIGVVVCEIRCAANDLRSEPIDSYLGSYLSSSKLPYLGR